MIDPSTLFGCLRNSGIEFYSGVPDSLLKEFTSYIFDHVDKNNYVITANEGAAVALSTGIFLATGKPALVYMQNSGIGNSINPILSLADPEVYSIPMVFMIGWRGMPGVKDEPQHLKQGRVQNILLDAMEIPYRIIGPDSTGIDLIINNLVSIALYRSGPVALIVEKDTFSKYSVNSLLQNENENLMSREYVLSRIIEALDSDDLVVSTTGMISREVFEVREQSHSGHHRDFLTVGSMGHCSQIALGIALKVPSRLVYCIDGDGAIIMHMGSLAVIGQTAPHNFKHIIINNMAHDSVGGQPTAASVINLSRIALSCNYTAAKQVSTEEELIKNLFWLKQVNGPVLLEIKVKKGARTNLGRPTITPIENRIDFQRNIRGDLA